MAGSSDKAAGEHEAGAKPDHASAAQGSEAVKTEGRRKQTTSADSGKGGKPAKADKNVKAEKAKSAMKAAPSLIRTRVAQAVWLLCVLAALFLSLGALVIALDFNQQNAAVEFVLNGADAVDLGVFTREDGIKQFSGENAATKNALVNYGVGAVFWIVVGRVADRFIRP